MKRKAFTLIELLVVIAILGLLAALLFPVFVKVRESTRRTSCQSNLRQLALAMQQYVADDDGQYPLINSVHGGIPFNWQDAVFPYVKSENVFYCPDYPVELSSLSRRIPPNLLEFPGYGYNGRWLNTFQWSAATPRRITHAAGTQEAVLIQPATTWLNLENGWLTSDASGKIEYLHSRPVTSSCGRHPTGGTLHSGGGNYSFLDGHVKWLTPEAMGEADCLNAPLPFPFKD